MIKFKMDDILKSESEAIVNPVNCEGIMGKGLAKKIKQKWKVVKSVITKLK